jgi:hypothetical protein
MEEQWRDIPGYEGLYQVSDQGNIKSLHSVAAKKSSRFIKERVMSNKIKSVAGHCIITLSNHGRTESIAIHTLVMLAFVGPRPAEHVVHHVDRNKTNNCLSNLVYCSSLDHRAEHRKHTTGKKRILKQTGRIIHTFADGNRVFYKNIEDAADVLGMEVAYVKIALVEEVRIDGGLLRYERVCVFV